MDEGANPPEGWSVPQRTPAVAAVATIGFLVVMLLLAGWIYSRTLRPERRQPVTTFPAPGVETFIHDGARDPHRPARAVQPDPAIEAAKRQVVAEGLAGWDKRP